VTDYFVGSQVRFTVTFRNAAGTATDPTAVVVKYKIALGTTVTLTYGVDGALVKSGTGVYYVDVTLTASGVSSFRAAGTGALVAAVEETLLVRDSYF
jgi:hypothetical protein